MRCRISLRVRQALDNSAFVQDKLASPVIGRHGLSLNNGITTLRAKPLAMLGSSRHIVDMAG